MPTTLDLGLKITPAQREYYRYTGPSADVERRGAGSSRPEQARIRRANTPKEATVPSCIPPQKD